MLPIHCSFVQGICYGCQPLHSLQGCFKKHPKREILWKKYFNREVLEAIKKVGCKIAYEYNFKYLYHKHKLSVLWYNMNETLIFFIENNVLYDDIESTMQRINLFNSIDGFKELPLTKIYNYYFPDKRESINTILSNIKRDVKIYC